MHILGLIAHYMKNQSVSIEKYNSTFNFISKLYLLYNNNFNFNVIETILRNRTLLLYNKISVPPA